MDKKNRFLLHFISTSSSRPGQVLNERPLASEQVYAGVRCRAVRRTFKGKVIGKNIKEFESKKKKYIQLKLKVVKDKRENN